MYIELIIAFLLGGVVAWIIATLLSKSKSVSKGEYEQLNQTNNSLTIDLKLALQRIESMSGSIQALQTEIDKHISNNSELNIDIQGLERDIALLNAELSVKNEVLENNILEINNLRKDVSDKNEELNKIGRAHV